MKIAIFTDTYHPQTNGVVSFLSDTISVLRKKHQVVLFAPKNKGKAKLENAGKNLKIYWVPATPFPFYEGYCISSMDYNRISEAVSKENPDIVHAHAPVILGVQGIIAAKRRKIPVVATYHTHFPDYVPHLLKGKLPEVLQGLSSMTVKKMIKAVYSLVDVATAPTKELARELRSYGIRNVQYLPNGVNFKRFKATEGRRERFRKKYGLGGKGVVLYTGRISFEKKLDKLIEAFKIIERKDRALLIVGGGPYLKQFREFAKSMAVKNTRFTGFVSDKEMAAAYACGHIFTSASDSETFGLTFIEAMHHGMPAIGVSRLGAKELIEDGKNGILVRPDDVAAMAAAMEKLLEDRKLAKELGRNAAIFAEQYSIENSTRRMIRIYKRLIRQQDKEGKPS